MAVKIKFDSTHNVLEPTFVLATRSGRKIGKIPACNVVLKDGLNTYSEISFRVYKVDCEQNSGFWDKITDFKLLWAREWNKWFEIYVETDEASDTLKNVSAKSLGEAELSQINLYGIEINTETDISREDYEPTVLYSDDPNTSLLTRITEKIPHYTIKHVDAYIASIQRTFTFDDKSIYDAFQEIAEEINCLFVLDCYSDSDNNIIREINVYDLESNCMDCKYRGEFLGSCPNCGSDNISTGYGDNTSIFVSTDNLADNIVFSTDNDSVKNCFRLEAGDDLMTATVVNCNPNGSAYLWYISDAVKEDMSPELAAKITEYDEEYIYYQNTLNIYIPESILAPYNDLIDKYSVYSDNYVEIKSPLRGYSGLMEAYYNTIDFYLYLNNTLMPSVEISETSASDQVTKLEDSDLSPVAVRDLDTCSAATVDSAVLSMAKVIVNARYQVKISNSSYSNKTWKGQFVITNYSDEEDTATSNQMTVTINDNYEDYVRQKIDKALRQNITDDEITDIVELFGSEDAVFINELKKYSLSRLTSFYDSCQCCIDVLMEQGVADKNTWATNNPNLYQELYIPYYNKLGYIEAEIKMREAELAVITGAFDDDGHLISHGLQSILDVERDEIQEHLDFEKYIGETLWTEFAAYRREDTYKNDNYISDGLDNAELFDNARQFIEKAQKDIYKSATLQHSITATLKNLLVMKEFEPIVEYFEVGNWIRIKVDNNIYRLRILDYEVDFDNLSNISITFSDVTATSDGISDINSVLNQAASISSSYDSTRRQAKQGQTSKEWLNNWVQKGLDATNVKIVSNADNQNQSWDSHGMLFREYDAVTDSYDNCQTKIINSTIAITDDNWESVKTAVGGFYYFTPDTGELQYAFGVNAETLIGKLILGESLGIYSTNNSMTFDKDGLKITNDINSFVVNPSSENLMVLSNSDGNILWVDNQGKLHITGDGAGLDITANDTVNNLSSQISQNASDIELEVQRATEAEGALSTSISQIEITTEGISLEVSNINGSLQTINSTMSVMQSSIEQNADNIALKVSKGDVCSEINQSSDTITLSSNRLIINSDNFQLTANGNITASNVELDGKIATVGDLDQPLVPVSGECKTLVHDGVIECFFDDLRIAKLMPIANVYTWGTGTRVDYQYGILASGNYDGIVIGGIYNEEIQTYYKINIQENASSSYDNCRHHFYGDLKFENGKVNSHFNFASNYGIQWGDNMGLRYTNQQDPAGLWLGITGAYACKTIITGSSALVNVPLTVEDTAEFNSEVTFNAVINANRNISIANNYGIDYGGNIAFRYTNGDQYGAGVYVGIKTGTPCDTHLVGTSVKINAETFVYEDITIENSYLEIANNYGITCGGNIAFRWRNNDALYCGITNAGLKLVGSYIYANGSTVATTSDQRKKQDITPLADNYLQLIKAVEPVSFKYTSDIALSGRTHTGFIAQQVLEAMNTSGINAEDFAAFVDLNKDGKEYALRYEEFIPLLLLYIQTIDNELQTLKEKKGDLNGDTENQ